MDINRELERVSTEIEMLSQLIKDSKKRIVELKRKKKSCELLLGKVAGKLSELGEPITKNEPVEVEDDDPTEWKKSAWRSPND